MPSLCVLLIEDDEHDATLILDALRHGGYELVAERVATADRLRAALTGQAWDLITCDDTLPGCSALAALALIRAQDSHVPIVVVSGPIGEELAAALIRAGADDVVLKHNVQRLPKAVEQAVRDATNRRRLPCAQATTDGAALKTTEQALRESEQRFRTLVEHAADAIYVHDAAGIITDANPHACESLGYSRDELIGRPLTDIDQHLDPDRVRQLLPQLWSGTPVLIETVHRRKDGTTFPVEIRSVRITWNGGPHVLGTCRDVTERKEAERALHASEERFALAVRGSTDGIWDWDLRTRELYFSPRWKEMLGLPGAATGELWRPRIHPDDVERLAAAIAPLLDGTSDNFECEHRLLHVDGTYRWVLARGIVLRDPTGKAYRMAGSQTDITDRKQAEEALRETRAALEVAVMAARAGLWDWDLQTGETHYSESWRTLFGYTPAEFDGSMEAWSKIVHPDDLERLAGSTSAATAIADPAASYAEEFRLRHKDGTYRWVLSRATVLRDAAGTPQRMLGAHVDITDRRQTELALRDSETRYRTLFESLDAAVLLVDGARCIDCNPATLRMFGLTSREEIIGKTALDFARRQQPDGTDSAEFVRGVLETAVAKGTHVFEWQATRPTGETFLVEVHFTPFKIGANQFFQGVAFDITERKQMERALREAQASLQVATESAKVAVWKCNLRSLTIRFSSGWKRVLGRDEGELTLAALWDLVHPGDRAKTSEAMQEHLQGRAAAYETEQRMLHADGSYRWVLSRGVVTYDTEGRPSHLFLGADIDITERKTLEETLREARAALEIAVAAARAGVWDWNLQTGATHCSESWRNLFGYSAAEFDGSLEAWATIVHADDLERLAESVRAAIETPASQYEEEFQLRHRDGTYRWVLSRATVLRDAAGIPQRMLGVHVDVTERTRLYTELAALNRELEARVAERTRQLLEAQERLNLVIDIASDGFWDWNLTTDTVYYSPR